MAAEANKHDETPLEVIDSTGTTNTTDHVSKPVAVTEDGRQNQTNFLSSLPKSFPTFDHTNAMGKSTKTIGTDQYFLDKRLALCKKRAACTREPLKVKMNKTSATLTMNTIVFEYFRRYIEFYLACKKYETKGRIFRDKEGLVTRNILQVRKNETHLYTINLYTTNSTVMVNGQSYTMFLQDDVPIILEKIKDMALDIEDANYQTNKYNLKWTHRYLISGESM